MYVPTPYAETRADVLLAAIRAGSFGTLITNGAGGIALTHLPFMPVTHSDGSHELIGHLARANPQWQNFAPTQDAVAAFVLDHAYILPGWYPSKAATGRVVPTWAYIAVEARGALTVVHHSAELRAMLHTLTERHEAARPIPWRMTDAPPDYIDGLLPRIVGVRLRVRSLTGAWKLDQQKSPADRAGAIAGLAADPATATMANRLSETP